MCAFGHCTIEVLIWFCFTQTEDSGAHSVWHQFEGWRKHVEAKTGKIKYKGLVQPVIRPGARAIWATASNTSKHFHSSVAWTFGGSQLGCHFEYVWLSSFQEGCTNMKTAGSNWFINTNSSWKRMVMKHQGVWWLWVPACIFLTEIRSECEINGLQEVFGHYF